MQEDHQSGGTRILIVGTGGQGVLTAARLLCGCFVERGHSVTSGQLHGMAQRGGAVQSSVMIDCGVSPVIPNGRADFVLGLEPVETARALPAMSARTSVFMNTVPVTPYVLAQRTVHNRDHAEYPDVAELGRAIREVAESLFTLDAAQLATEAGSGKAINMVLLGCLFGVGTLPCSADAFIDFVSGVVPTALRQTNVVAFRRGVAAVQEAVVGGNAG